MENKPNAVQVFVWTCSTTLYSVRTFTTGLHKPPAGKRYFGSVKDEEYASKILQCMEQALIAVVVGFDDCARPRYPRSCAYSSVFERTLYYTSWFAGSAPRLRASQLSPRLWSQLLTEPNLHSRETQCEPQMLGLRQVFSMYLLVPVDNLQRHKIRGT